VRFNPYDAIEKFEECISIYTKSKYAIAIDNCSNAIFLSLKYINVEGREVEIPSHTYPSVPCAIIHAGGKVKFRNSSKILKGAYQLGDTGIWDAALRFTANMYIPNNIICLSFTGPHKQLKLGKGGAILTDDEKAYKWFKKAIFSGRNKCSYLQDDFTMLGWNFYMLPEIATRGILLMNQFVSEDGIFTNNEDVAVEYPDLSKFEIYKR
jgi:dTDP-4-amino-4,6-dideoxygalactose transaminase